MANEKTRGLSDVSTWDLGNCCEQPRMFLFFFGGEYFFVLQTGDTTVAQQMNTILTLLLYGFNQEFKGIFNAIEWNTGVIKKSTIL